MASLAWSYDSKTAITEFILKIIWFLNFSLQPFDDSRTEAPCVHFSSTASKSGIIRSPASEPLDDAAPDSAPVLRGWLRSVRG